MRKEFLNTSDSEKGTISQHDDKGQANRSILSLKLFFDQLIKPMTLLNRRICGQVCKNI